MITVVPAQFSGREEAIALIEASGLFRSEAQLSQAELTGAPHTHPYDVDIYLLEGVLELHEPNSGQVHQLEKGSRAFVPAGTLHAETCPGPFRAVFGVSVDPEPLLAQRKRDGASRQLQSSAER
jgi:hypothetical protein